MPISSLTPLHMRESLTWPWNILVVSYKHWRLQAETLHSANLALHLPPAARV